MVFSNPSEIFGCTLASAKSAVSAKSPVFERLERL